MLSVVIKIDQSKLSNPEADIRYQLPIYLQEATDDHIKDDGYDYLKDGTLVIHLLGDDESYVSKLVEALIREPFLGNNLKDAVTVGFDVGPGYTVCYPPDFDGDFSVE